MTLSLDNVVHHNSGTFTGTSGSAALAGGETTEAGNTVILVVYSIGSGTLTTPTGFVLDHTASGSATHKIAVFRRSNVPAGESSWTAAVSASQLTFWIVREYSDIDVNSPKLSATSVGTSTLSATTDRSINSIYAANPSEDAIVIGVSGAFLSGATPPDLFVSPNETGTAPARIPVEGDSVSATGGGNAATLTLFEEFSGALVGAFYTGTITYQSDIGAINYADVGVAYRAKPTALYPVLTHILGAQHGTSAGWTTGNAGFTYLTSASAGVSITSTNPRHHTYAFRCNATTTACNFTDKATTIAGGVYVGRFSFRLNSTPGANLELGGTVSGVTFRYVQATGKIGCTLPGGTEQVSVDTVTSGNWYSIDYRIDTSGTAWQCEWSTMPDSTKVITPETTATATGVTTTSFQPRWGWTTATTGDVNFSDLIGSSSVAAYPLGDYQVRVMKIDATRSALTPTTPANWKLFTANGTLANWNDATAAATMDDLPATIGASADGLVQVTVDAEVQGVYFETLTLGATGSAKGARCCAIGWATSATAATIAARFAMGSAFDNTYAPVADYNFDNSTTTPAWVCSGVQGSGGSSARITSAILTNAVGSTSPGIFFFGASNDATPDVGFHAAYLEVAVKVVAPLTLMRGPDDSTMVSLYQDTDTSGYVGLQFTAPSDRGMSYTYEFPSGTTVGPTALAAGASSSVIVLDANLLTSVPRVNCTLDPVP